MTPGKPMTEGEVVNLGKGLDWIVVRTRLNHAEQVAREILNYPADPRRNEATKILELIERVQRAYKRGWHVPAAEMDQLYRLCNAANAKLLGPLTARAAKATTAFLDVAASENRKRHQEAKVTWATWRALAAKIWKRHPEWSNSAVALKIVETVGGNHGTIRKKIAHKK